MGFYHLLMYFMVKCTFPGLFGRGGGGGSFVQKVLKNCVRFDLGTFSLKKKSCFPCFIFIKKTAVTFKVKLGSQDLFRLILENFMTSLKHISVLTP